MTGALLSGCATGPGTYRVSIPELTAKPVQGTCKLRGEPADCTLLLTRDYQSLVRELKAACLALGGSPESCQTE